MKENAMNNPICSFSKPEGPCQDDVGSPMICAWGRWPLLAGIHTVGNKDCSGGYNGLARVSTYRGWMRNTIVLANRRNVRTGAQCVPGPFEDICRDDNAVCSPSARYYKCLCKLGFVPRDRKCVPINRQPVGAPCMKDAPRPCVDKKAECRDTNGSYTCECLAGYRVNNGNRCEAKELEWDGLRVTWNIDPAKTFKALPRTRAEAERDGWVNMAPASGCNTHPNFLGERYWKDNDLGAIPIFGPAGYIAGIQAGFPSNSVVNYPPEQLKNNSIIQDGANYYLTAYFVNPGKLCAGRSSADFRTQGTGTGLWIQNGLNAVSDSIEIPRLQSDTANTLWSLSPCLRTMGVHYWYNLTTDMSCDTMLPVFLLYNGGVLNAFGLGLTSVLNNSYRFEHPAPPSYKYFLDPVPDCLMRSSGVTTLHFFLTNNPVANTC